MQADAEARAASCPTTETRVAQLWSVCEAQRWPEGPRPALCGEAGKHIPARGLCALGAEDRAGALGAAGTTGEERKDVLGKRPGSTPDSLASPEKGRQQHIWGPGLQAGSWRGCKDRLGPPRGQPCLGLRRTTCCGRVSSWAAQNSPHENER